MSVGVSLIANGNELASWPSVPASFRIPGTQIDIVGAAVGWEGDGYRLVNRVANDPPSAFATLASESAAFDGMQVVVTRSYADHAPPVPEQISDRQFFQGLAVQGIISKADALAAVKVGTMPSALEAFVLALPSDAQFNAEMLLSGATLFNRSHPLTAQFGAAQGWSSDQIDTFWRACSVL